MSVLSFTLLAGRSILDLNEEKEWPGAKDKWVQIFNGKNLKNWTVKIKGYPYGENWKNTFVVEEGVLKVDYAGYKNFDSKFGHIFYKNSYSNYRLKLQYRFTGEQVPGGPGWAIRNSGVMIHCQDPKTMELDQDFPVSLEVQLLGGIKEGVHRATGNLCTPGTHVEMDKKLVTNHCINSSSSTYYGDQWVDMEILVMNDSLISHLINGKEVISYNKPVIGGNNNPMKDKDGQALKGGYISLQSESHPVEFKNILLMELD